MKERVLCVARREVYCGSVPRCGNRLFTNIIDTIGAEVMQRLRL